MKPWGLALFVGAGVGGVGAAAVGVWGCSGGNVVSTIPLGDAGGIGADATTDDASEATGSDTGTGGDGATPGDASGSADAGTPACPAPVDTTKSAVCVSIDHEAIAFLTDPAFDGQGVLSVEIFSRAFPDDDGGPATLAPGQLLPTQPDGGTPDGGFSLLDLTQPVPMTRFEVTADRAFLRAIFIDDPSTLADGGSLQAGWWLGGLDLANGVDKAPLLPVPLTAGQGTSVTLHLTALRQLKLAVSTGAGVTPAGNGQGPFTAIAVNTTTPFNSTTSLFGIATQPCANPIAQAVTVPGWVVGKGPYSVLATLDDFGKGGLFPAGGMFSLAFNDAGEATIPPGDTLTYPANAYQVTGAATLTYVSPAADGGGPDADSVVCP